MATPISRILDSAGDISDSNNDLPLLSIRGADTEDKRQAALDLLQDISDLRAAGLVTPYSGIVLACDSCNCVVQASVTHPEPIHHCGTPLRVETCECCDLPATYWYYTFYSGTVARSDQHKRKVQ